MSPLDASRLDVTVTEGARWRRTLSVTVPADMVEAERGAITRQLASRVKVKGFRSGKVPASVVAQRFGSTVDREVLDQLIQDAYKQAVSANELRPISDGRVEDVKFTPSEPLSFKVSFDVRPEFSVQRMGGFKVERPRPDVDPEAVAQVIERLRSQHAAWRTATEGTPGPGDFVEVELARTSEVEGEAGAVEAKRYEFVLGEGNALPDIEAAIQTLVPGSEGEFDVEFPDDHPDEDRRGEIHRTRIRLLDRRIQELPDVDDDFARTVGEFEDVASLQSTIAEDMAKDAERRAEAAVRGRLLEQILEANSFEVPESMVEAYLDSMIGTPEGIEPEKLAELRAQLRSDAEVAVKKMLLIDRIGEQQGLRATEEEVDQKIEDLALRMGESPSKVYANLQKSGRLASLEQDLTEEKLFDFLKSQSEITEAP